MTQESQLELETGSSEPSPPSHSESSAQSCQTLTLDLRDLHHTGDEMNFIAMLHTSTRLKLSNPDGTLDTKMGEMFRQN